MKNDVYELVSENLTNLGGSMGSEHTFTNWRKHFDSIKKAKAYAVKDYSKSRPKAKSLKWFKTEKGLRSDDLLFVMYYINKLNIK